MSLIHKYLLNESGVKVIVDSVPGGINGTTVINTTTAPGPDLGGGSPAASMLFAAVDTDDVILDELITLSGPFTLTWWAKVDPDAQFQFAVGYSTNGSTRFGYTSAGLSTLHWRINNLPNRIDVMPSSRDVWHFMSFVRDAADLVTVKVNLVAAGAASINGGDALINKIGGNNLIAQDYIGNLADVRIYDHGSSDGELATIFGGRSIRSRQQLLVPN